MSETLVINLGHDGLPVGEALLVDGGSVRGRIGPEALASKAGTDTVLVIPGDQVASQRISVPDFPDAKLMKILPGLLDGRLALAQEERHFALMGTRDGETGERLVGVMAKSVLQAALGFSEANGLPVRTVVPDYMLLPVPEEGAVAAKIGEFVLARISDGTGFSVEADLAAAMLGEAGAASKQMSDAEFEELLVHAQAAEGNLLQGAFSPRSGVADWVIFFRRAGLLAAASLMVWIGASLYAATDNFNRADALYAKAEERFRAALPDVSRVVNMEAQMRRAVQDVRQQGGGEFMILSNLAADALAGDDSTMFESMRFDGERSTLVLTVTFASFAKGEAFKTRLAEKGLVVTEGSSRTEGARVSSELTIRRRV